MAVKNSLAPTLPKQGLAVYLSQDAIKNQINGMIGSKSGSRFISSIVSAVQANAALQECTNKSIVSAALLGESLNLSPSPQLGQYYLVPFNNNEKQTKEAQFQLGYKGYIQLATRSGQYKKLNVLAIKEGELVRFDPLNEEIEVTLIEDEEARENAATIGYYAMFEYVNGFRKAIYWSKQKMLAHAGKYSKAFHAQAVENSNPKYSRVSYADFERGSYPKGDAWKYSSFWYKDFDGMAFKTMLRQLISKWGVMSIEMQQAYDADMAVLHEDGTKQYVEAEENVVVSEQAAEPGQADSHAPEVPAGDNETTAMNDIEQGFFS